MEILISIIIIGIVVYVLKNRNSQVVVHHAPVIEERVIVGYKKKLRIMNKTECALFFELKKQISPNYYIFPNMRLADIVITTNNNSDYEARRKNQKIMPKHIDFMICDYNFMPIVAIELNGGYHNNPKQIASDLEKRRILDEAQLPLITINVGDNFNEAVLKITSFLPKK